MEHYGGLPLNSTEIELHVQETYVTLERSILDDIVQHMRESAVEGPFADEYFRVSSIDGQVERVGIILVDTETGVGKSANIRYDVTVLQYKEGEDGQIVDPASTAEMDKRTYAIKLPVDREPSCYTSATFASGTRIGQHKMNAVEHSMLLDELLAVRAWQLAAQRERAILK
jgi:hypothetical protein